MKNKERETIKRLLEIERERAFRRETDGLKRYKPGKKQEAFHRCLKRNRWIFGGNRSGKTYCGAAEAVYIALGVHPYRPNRKNARVWVVSLSAQVQRDVAQSAVLKMLCPRLITGIVMQSGSRGDADKGVIDFITARNAFGGESYIYFRNCEQGREKFQGVSADAVWFDEEPPADIYEECRMRVLDRKGDIFGTMTPLKGLTWVYDLIYTNAANDGEIWCVETEWADNPYLDADEIARMSAALSPSELETRRYGRFAREGGRVYPEFDVEKHVIEPFDVPPEWYDNISVDPGLRNPLSAHWYAVDFDGNVYAVAEHYEAERDIEYHAARIKDICARLNWHTDAKGRPRALIDSAASARSLAAGKSVCELFYEFGISVNPRVNKDLFSGIQRVKLYLKGENGRPKLFVFKNCPNLIREFKNYAWGDDDIPVKRDDHALDELRYYLASRPEARKDKRDGGEIERDKERLIRRNRKKCGIYKGEVEFSKWETPKRTI